MATLPNTAAPTNNDYGGDEVSALVLDPGTYWTRAGFAGEDVPKSVVPSSYGSTRAQPYIFGDDAINRPQPDLEINSPMAEDGTVRDWEAAAKLWQHTIATRLLVPQNPRGQHPRQNGLHSPGDKKPNGEPDDLMDLDEPEELDLELLAEHPLLMTEPGWTSAKHREKAIEMAIEEWGVPAFWLARNGVLAAFASGKPSALVVDVGAASTSITPVHDGMQLRKGTVRSVLGGDFLSQQTRHLFASATPPVPLHPQYLIASKTAVDAGQPASATYHSFPAGAAPAPSYHAYQEERVLHEFKETVVQVWPGPGRFAASAPGLSGEEVAARVGPARPFEFPDGANQAWGADRLRVAEGLFDPKQALGPADRQPAADQALPAALHRAIGQCDADARNTLLANVVVVGGGSMCAGFNDRVHEELQGLFPGARVRVQSPGNTYERKYASWIGGSILASLGTFHQMWISKREYEEQGAGIVEKRCK